MKNLKRAAIVAAAAVLLMLGLATPAHATVYWGCPSGTGCTWINDSGGGARYTVSVGGSGIGVCHNFPIGYRNNASSYSTDYGNGHKLTLYDALDCGNGGFFGTFQPDSSHFSCSFTTVFSWFNDKASSFKIV